MDSLINEAVYQTQGGPFKMVVLLLLIFIYLGSLSFLVRTYLRASWINTLALSAGIAVFSFLGAWRRYSVLSGYQYHLTEQDAVRIVFSALMISFSGILALRMLNKWFMGDLTEAEKTPGPEGFRAWLVPTNLFLCVAIVIAFWICEPNPVGDIVYGLFLLVCLLLLFPLVNTIYHHSIRRRKEEDEAQARLKIVDLLESGKITPDECAELLKAIRKSGGNENGEHASDTPVA